MKKIIMLILIFSLILPFGCDVSNNKPSIQPSKIETVLTGYVYDHSSKISRETAGQIVKAALKEKYPLLVLAIASAESEFVPTAVSPKGATGLMQVMPNIHSATLIKAGIIKEVRDLYSVNENIKAGATILDQCLKESKGDVSRGLSRYVSGHDGLNDSTYVRAIQSNLTTLYTLTAGL